MTVLDRIANSAPFQKHFRFPGRHSIQIFTAIMTVIGLIAVVASAYYSYRDAALSSVGGTSAMNDIVVSMGIAICGTIFFSIMFLLFWAIFYRIGTDIVDGFIAVKNWMPTAWQRSRSAVRTTIAFVSKIPGLLRRFFRGCGEAFIWFYERPRWWSVLTKKQRSSLIFTTVSLVIFIGIFVAVLPVAVRLSAAAPTWMKLNDQWFLTFFIDMILGDVAITVVTIFLALVFAGLSRLCR